MLTTWSCMQEESLRIHSKRDKDPIKPPQTEWTPNAISNQWRYEDIRKQTSSTKEVEGVKRNMSEDGCSGQLGPSSAPFPFHDPDNFPFKRTTS